MLVTSRLKILDCWTIAKYQMQTPFWCEKSAAFLCGREDWTFVLFRIYKMTCRYVGLYDFLSIFIAMVIGKGGTAPDYFSFPLPARKFWDRHQ